MSGDGTGAIKEVLWADMPHGCQVVDITTKSGIVITVHVSQEGRSARVWKRKPGKASHQLVVNG